MLMSDAVEESFPVTLTLQAVSSTTAILKWNASSTLAGLHAVDSSSDAAPRLLVRRLSIPVVAAGTATDDGNDGEGGDDDAREELGVRVMALDSAETDGHYHLDQLTIGQAYSAQLVVDQPPPPYYTSANISNVVYFTTTDGVATLQFVNFRMHPAELGVVVLILAAWAGAIAAFLHKWRRLRIVPPRQLRYKHAPPKNLDAIQVVSKPNDSVIYKSYTRQLSTTMEARRSRLERMQTLPNIKLSSPTSSPRHTVLDSTPEVPCDIDATADLQRPQQRRRRPGKAKSFVKRMSEGRFFLADLASGRRTTSPSIRQKGLPKPAPVAAPVADSSLQDRLQSVTQFHASLTPVDRHGDSTEQSQVVYDKDIGGGLDSDQINSSVQRTSEDDLGQTDELTGAANDDAETPLKLSTISD